MVRYFFFTLLAMQYTHVLITGASSGIGEAIARSLAAKGCHLWLVARRKERLIALQDELQNQYPNIQVFVFALDVRSSDAVKDLFEDLSARELRPNVIVNNAGLAAGLAEVDVASPEDWDRMIDTNVKGALYVMKYGIPLLKNPQGGHIIQMSSVVSREVYAGGSVYSATKHALDAIHRTLRLELLPWPIKLTSINPGLVETEFSLVRFAGDADRAQQVYKDIEALKAEDVADVVAYCLSLPKHVNLPEVHITASAQATATKVRKKDGSIRG